LAARRAAVKKGTGAHHYNNVALQHNICTCATATRQKNSPNLVKNPPVLHPLSAAGERKLAKLRDHTTWSGYWVACTPAHRAQGA
jgi:hypothetical protein